MNWLHCRCLVPGELVNETYPWQSEEVLRWVPLRDDNTLESCVVRDPDSNGTVGCDAWVYDPTYHPSTRVIEVNPMTPTLQQTNNQLDTIRYSNKREGEEVPRNPKTCVEPRLSLLRVNIISPQVLYKVHTVHIFSQWNREGKYSYTEETISVPPSKWNGTQFSEYVRTWQQWVGKLVLQTYPRQQPWQKTNRALFFHYDQNWT